MNPWVREPTGVCVCVCEPTGVGVCEPVCVCVHVAVGVEGADELGGQQEGSGCGWDVTECGGLNPLKLSLCAVAVGAEVEAMLGAARGPPSAAGRGSAADGGPGAGRCVAWVPGALRGLPGPPWCPLIPAVPHRPSLTSSGRAWGRGR